MALKSKLLTEYYAGDNMKVIGEMCHQLCDFNKFQNAEILSLVKADLEVRGLPPFNKASKRPKAKGEFVENYHSGNDLTRSQIAHENNGADRLEVIYRMCCQLSKYDGLSSVQILALIESYLDVHIIEVDA